MTARKSQQTVGDAEHGENKHPQACHANGCPMIGTHTSSTNGEGPWLCWLHENVRMSQADTVTLSIHQNAWLIKLYGRVEALHSFDWPKARDMAAEFCRQKGRPDLAPAGDEKQHAYKTRLRAACFAATRPPKEAKKIDAKPKAENDGRLANFLPDAA